MPALSGQTVVSTAGFNVPIGDQVVNAPVIVKAFHYNTGDVFIGNDGANDVDDSGFILAPGEEVTFAFVGNLASIRLNAAVNGEGIAWLILST